MKNDKEEGHIGYNIVKPIFKFIIKMLYRPKLINKDVIPLEGPVILAGNHTDNFDPLIVCMSTKRMVHFMAKKELHDMKIFGKFFLWVGTIPVDRTIKDSNAKSKAIEVLGKGYVFGIFPEGTVNRTEAHLLPLKMGTVSFAKKTNATIVPFAIGGNFSIFNKNLRVRFGIPFKITGMNLEDANEKLTSEISNLLTIVKREVSDINKK